ncbi:type II secretion system F family protein [Olsenella sp. YH-ols2217]|uniref:Type II secretion system F family protein n=1 Tax=Kribbibacterium absianum TaxID=3044210 RepID=A0ABT6ZL81_9ACTN|nr:MULTISPECIES: type II secretion system F family protein [unclassified Olsenella]MDJ1121793.1 type II secretion system F family protein [Olsenella sp. YH-ols2216]MDJ1129801.1 type II secretion system F family protein [Olsenella sp. YH-ols2217]
MAHELWLSAAAAGAAALTVTSGLRGVARPRNEVLWLLERTGERTVPLLAWRPWAVATREMGAAAVKHGHELSRLQACGAVAWGVGGVGIGCAVLAWSPVAFPLGVVGATALLVPLASAWERARRRRATDSLPDAYRSLAGALGTGRTLAQAVEYVGRHAEGEVGAAFEAASLELSCGSSLDRALEVLAGALPPGTAGLLVTALEVSQRTGAPLRGLLEEAASLLEERAGLVRLLQTKTAQARLSARVVMALPAALVLLLALLSPDFRDGVATPIGAASLAIAALLDLAALALMRLIMRGAVPRESEP